MYLRVNSDEPGDPCIKLACKFLSEDGVICYPTETILSLIHISEPTRPY